MDVRVCARKCPEKDDCREFLEHTKGHAELHLAVKEAVSPLREAVAV
jgi:hypothetical protein